MAIEAGETAVAPAPQVDAETLAKSIVDGVFARMPVQEQAPQTRQERVSAFDSKAKALLADGRIDKDVMPVMLELIEAMGQDLTAKQQQEAVQAAQQASTSAIHSELGRMIERYAASSANPELVRELKDSITKKAIDEYNKEPGLVRKYQQNGSVDWSEMDKLVVKQVTKWSGEGTRPEAKPAGGIAMKNSAPAGAAESDRALDKDSLSERQQDLFNAQVSFAQKNMGLNKADAEKRALDQISKAESKLKAAKR